MQMQPSGNSHVTMVQHYSDFYDGEDRPRDRDVRQQSVSSGVNDYVFLCLTTTTTTTTLQEACAAVQASRYVPQIWKQESPVGWYVSSFMLFVVVVVVVDVVSVVI